MSEARRARIGAIVLATMVLVSVGVVAAATLTAGGGSAYETDTLRVETVDDHSVGFSNPAIDTNTLEISNVTFSGGSNTGMAELTVEQFEGTWTNVSSVTTNGSSLTINPGDKDAVNVSGAVTKLEFRDVVLDQGRSEFIYSATGDGTVQLNGLQTSTDWAAVADGAVIDSGTTGTNGTATVSVPAATDSGVELFINDAPTVSPVDPLDGSQLTQPTQNITVDVDDPDFSTTSAEELDVEIYVDGDEIYSTTATGAGEITTEHTFDSGGEHTWYATVTDTSGESAETATQTVEVAAELRVLNESSPSELVNSTTVDVTFYGTNETVTRSADDGTISFAGLPLDRRFEAEVSADGYETRTIVIPSLLEQQRAWLLPESTQSVEVRFRLQDATGTYSQRSELFIEKPITINNDTEYRIITSRQFGVDGVTTTLESDTRYDLRVRNQNGDVAQLSTYSATVSETVTLEPSVAAVEKPTAENIGYEIDYSADSERINIEYVDPAGDTESLTVSVKSRDGETTLRAPQTYTDTSSLSLSVPTNGTLNKTYLVNMTGTRGSEEIDISQPVGPDQRSIVPPGLDQTYGNILGIMSVLLVAGVFSTLNAGVGALVTALFGGVLWFFGILSGVASGGSVLLAIGIAALNAFNSR